MELLHLAAGAQLPDPIAGTWFRVDAAASLVGALRDGREGWVCPQSRRIGFLRARRDEPDGDHRLIEFLMVAQGAAGEMAGLPGSVPGQLVSAMEELENNIHEHAGAPHTGVIAFRATAGIFEFVASDRGIGVLESLRSCAAYADLPDAGKALEAALTEGVSKHGPGSRHGNGFRPIFIGLMNLRGFLRFRSGDHALTMDGSSPELSMARIAQKPPIDGFFASVTCYA